MVADIQIPNPGSLDAYSQGCRCPITTNNHGEAPPYPWATPPDSQWDVSNDCPLHAADGGRREMVLA